MTEKIKNSGLVVYEYWFLGWFLVNSKELLLSLEMVTLKLSSDSERLLGAVSGL